MSRLAKKITLKILESIKAGIPNAYAANATEVARESPNPNDPRLNNTFIIISGITTSAITEGIEKIKDIKIAYPISALAWENSSWAIYFDNIGNNAVEIAIPTIPNGN